MMIVLLYHGLHGLHPPPQHWLVGLHHSSGHIFTETIRIYGFRSTSISLHSPDIEGLAYALPLRSKYSSSSSHCFHRFIFVPASAGYICDTICVMSSHIAIRIPNGSVASVHPAVYTIGYTSVVDDSIHILSGQYVAVPVYGIVSRDTSDTGCHLSTM
jgi:hypothetical protein